MNHGEIVGFIWGVAEKAGLVAADNALDSS